MPTYNYEQGFKNPDRRYAIFPIIHGAAVLAGTDGGIDGLSEKLDSLGLIVSVSGDPGGRGLLDKLDELGFAGVVGNTPYGPGYPDDAGEWDITEKGYRSFIARGMKTWIYDEKGYPSGTAGGLVVDENPDFIAEGLYCYEYWRTLTGPIPYRADVPGDRLYRALLLPLDGGEAVDVTRFQDGKGVLRLQIPEGEYHLFMMSSRRLFDGTHAAESYGEPRNYISLNDREATKAFIRVTHEKYAERLSDEFGKGVLAFFLDEPSLISWNIRQGVYPIVPWHRNFPGEFEAVYGYPIELAVTAVVTKRGPDVIKRRCDFWEFVGESVADNFFGVIQDWCRAHGVKSSGHMLWEEHIQSHVYCYGSLYKCGRRMDWPGIDQLDSDPRSLMRTDCIPIARLLASFADISGENESFTEFSDHSSKMSNRQVGLDWIRASVNWHYAMGVNNLTSYYKFDYFGDAEIIGLNRYAARLGYLIRQGRRDSRVAVLYPEAAIWSVYTPSIKAGAYDDSEDVLSVDNTFSGMSWELLHRQIDFDYVDERLILDAEIRGDKLTYKHNAYECVVLPAARVLSSATADKIIAMADAGIGVVIVGELPKYARETGKPADFSDKLLSRQKMEKFSVVPVFGGWTLPGRANIPALPRTVTITPERLDCVLTGSQGSGGYIDGEVISPDILSHVRLLENGDRIVFLCNMGAKTYEGTLRVEGGSSMRIADPHTGGITYIETRRDNGAVTADIKIRPYDAYCYIVSSRE